MDYLIAFVIAFFLSFFGMIPPGMITLKLVSIGFNKSVKAAILFALGVSFVEFFQTILTLHFSTTFVNYFNDNNYIKWGAVFLLLVLAISYFIAKPKPINDLNLVNVDTIKKKTSFFKGVFLSVFNILKYPFWIAQGIYFMRNGILQDEWSFLIVYSFGAVIGSFSMYYIYIRIGKTILTEFNALAKNFNKILALFFALLAIVQVLNIYNG